VVVTFLHEFVQERMIARNLLVVHYIYRRVSSSRMINLQLLMGCLRVMVIQGAVSRILNMMKVRTAVEYSYQRTGAWFLLLGNKQEL